MIDNPSDVVTPPRPSPTVSDVARLSGVSIATVSRVFNNVGNPAADKRAKVMEAAQRLGYVPHAAARALASQRSRLIGAVVPTIENPNFARMVETLQRVLADRDYTLLLASSGYDGRNEDRQVRALVGQGVDAVVLVGGLHEPETIELLRRKDIPYVNTFVLDAQHPCVGFDNEMAGRMLADFLLDLGHLDFGVIAGVTSNNDRASARVAGIRSALLLRGVALPRERLIERPYRIVEGQLGFRALMDAYPRPTAVICGNDVLAFGALLEADRLGIAVPGEVSIAGFDDLEFSERLKPSLTTIKIDAEQIGARTAERILQVLSGQPAVRVTEVATSLLVRQSTGRPGDPAISSALPRQR